MHIDIHVKYPLFLLDFNETWTLSTDFEKILKYQLPRKRAQWEPSFFSHPDGETDGQTDMTKLTVAFRNSANAPEKHDGHVPDFRTYLHRFLETCV